MGSKLEIKNPYVPSTPVLVPPDTISAVREQATAKHRARYPSGHITNEPGGEGASENEGKMKRRAYTPGGPAGS